MKNLISSTLSVLMLSAAVAIPAVQAQTTNRPAMPGGTDQGIPGVTNQSQTSEPDMGESNTTINQMDGTSTTESGTSTFQQSQQLDSNDAVERPAMPGGTDQGIPGVTNQSQTGEPDAGESNTTVPGATGFESQPSQINQEAVGTTGTTASTLTVAADIDPFELINLARNGYLEEAGIPAFGDLVNSYKAKTTTAEEIVQAGINLNRIPANTIDDTGYVHAVAVHLEGLLDRTSGDRGVN